jgi:hypothetical protein
MSLIEEDPELSEVSFTDLVRNLQKTFEKRADFQRAVVSQHMTIQMNAIAKEQKREVSKAVRQIRAAKYLELGIDVDSLLLSEEKAKAIMRVWAESISESDVDKAERFKGDCLAWTEKVAQSVDKSWKDECDHLLQVINRHAGLLKSLKKFKRFEIDYSSHRDRLESRSQRHAFFTKVEELIETKTFIKILEDEIKDLGSLPDGLLDFMDRVNSNDGVPLLVFMDAGEKQMAIRKWLEDNGFIDQLILKARI